MKTKFKTRLNFGAVLLFLSFNFTAQTIQYSYDQNGNRTERKLAVCLTCPLAGKQAHNDTTKKMEQLAAKYGVATYPNPTLDKVNLDITNLPTGQQADIELVDASGKFLFAQKNVMQQSQIDMYNYQQGIYYLRVSIGKDVMIYKIMKVQ